MKLVALFAVLVAVATPTASAEDRSADPEAATPAGVVYQRPLDQARNDAAPKRAPAGRLLSHAIGGGSSGSRGSTTQTAPVSALRSENGFGSSSVVPGSESAVRTGTVDTRKAGASPSSTRAYLLLALVLAVGIAVGLTTYVRAGRTPG